MLKKRTEISARSLTFRMFFALNIFDKFMVELLLAVLLACDFIERRFDRIVQEQRILPLPEQLDEWLIHIVEQLREIELELALQHVVTVNINVDNVLREGEGQRTDNRCLVERWNGEMLREGFRIRADIDYNALLLAVEKERELVFGRWKIDHEERLQRDEKLSARPVNERERKVGFNRNLSSIRFIPPPQLHTDRMCFSEMTKSSRMYVSKSDEATEMLYIWNCSDRDL